MAVTIRPLSDRVVVELAPNKERLSAGGLVLPGAPTLNVHEQAEGVVICTGKGQLTKRGRKPMELREGDKIVYNAHTGSTLKFNNKEYRLLREGDVFGVLTGE